MQQLTMQASDQNKKLDLVLEALYNLAGVFKESALQNQNTLDSSAKQYIKTENSQTSLFSPLYIKIVIGVTASALLIMVILQGITFYLNF